MGGLERVALVVGGFEGEVNEGRAMSLGTLIGFLGVGGDEISGDVDASTTGSTPRSDSASPITRSPEDILTESKALWPTEFLIGLEPNQVC